MRFYWLARVSVRSWKEGRICGQQSVRGQTPQFVASLHENNIWIVLMTMNGIIKISIGAVDRIYRLGLDVGGGGDS